MDPSVDAVDALALDDAALLERMHALVARGRRAEALSLYARVRDRLWDSVGREPAAELRALQADLLADAIRSVPRPRDASMQPARSVSLRPLPTESSTSYVGRAELTETVTNLFDTARVVTLHGPGGVGKTRLALSVAHRTAAGGTLVAWIDLAPARDPESALYAAADAIGVRDIALDDPVGSLVRALGEESTVVVVDNCEHLLDVAAHLVDGLQARSRGTRVLATSREPLDVDGEHIVPVPPLATGETPDSPALQLFADRVTTARGYPLDADEIADAIAVTQRLDGLPLALELAAARGAALGVSQLRDRVGLDLLDRGLRTSSPRHRSLRGVVDWSYALLDDAEQALFARLSVFAGTFALARAEVVCADDRVPAARLPSLLSDLVDRSLVSTVRLGGDSRHRLLQPLREYAAEQLVATGESRRWQTAHARHIADVASARALAMHGPGEPGATEQLAEDLDESRVALEHAQASGDVDTAMRLVDAMHDLGSRQMRLELLGWADSVASMPGADPHPLYPAVLGTAAKGRWLRGDLDGAMERAQRALETAADPADPRRVRGLLAMAEVNLVAGQLATAADYYRAAIELDAAPGPSTDAEGGLAMTLADLGATNEGVGLADRALARAEASAAPSHLAWAWYAQGRCWAASDPAKAVTMLERSAELSHSVDNHSNEYSARTRLLVVREQLTDPLQLLSDYRATLQRWRRTGSSTFLSVTLRNLAGLLERLGRTDDAASLRSAVGVTVAEFGHDDQVDQAYTLALDVIDQLSPTTTTAVPQPRPSPDPRAGVFQADADVWTVGLDGTEVHVADSKGMHDIAVLLARPDVEVHCLDLAGGGGATSTPAPTNDPTAMRREADLGDVLDPAARTAYEQRIRDLRADIDEQADHPDVERWQAEMDFLVAELAAAYGLGKRPRRAGDPVEKARTAVTWRIKHALRRISRAHPPLGAHLTSCVKTGRYCVYAPDGPVTWSL